MILQTINPPTATEVFYGILALITNFILIAIFFGTCFYFFTIVYRFKERTEGSEKHFWLRSFAIGLIAVLIIYAIQFAFSLLLFSPAFYENIPVDLMNAVLATDIRGIVAALTTTPVMVLGLFVIMIVMIIAIMSYVMLGIYKVKYAWTTLLTWSGIGIYLILDIIISFTFNQQGFAGIMVNIGDAIRGLA